MKRSTDRILTTHSGSMVRPTDLADMILARQRGEAIDEAAFEARVKEAVDEAVKQQCAIGIDVPCDGELSKAGFLGYINSRLNGFEQVALTPEERATLSVRRDRQRFAEYYAEYQPTAPGGAAAATALVCTGPISYKGEAEVQRDIANLKASLQGQRYEEAFIPAIAPGTFARGINRQYKTEEEFRFAIAEALRTEYEAIVNAGFVLQIDDPGLGETWDMINPEPTVAEYRKLSQIRIEALNHGLRNIPEDRVRYHICWGSWQAPHTTDIPLRDVVDVMLMVKAQAYSVEAANPRHEWEWQVWEETKLPEGKILIPGVIAHTTAVVEHPETVAMRLNNFVKVAGKENVIGGTDCGFAQGTVTRRQHPSVMWAKFEALVKGAALLSKRLWS
jgi:5-methyltetrahydropteroyltriglutamate--homocysteine methyltransferase